MTWLVMLVGFLLGWIFRAAIAQIDGEVRHQD